MASALIVVEPKAGFVSSVAIAIMAADLVSAMKSTPSGPNVSWLMALNSGLPSFMPAVSPARAAGAATARANIPNAREHVIFFIGREYPWGGMRRAGRMRGNNDSRRYLAPTGRSQGTGR